MEFRVERQGSIANAAGTYLRTYSRCVKEVGRYAFEF